MLESFAFADHHLLLEFAWEHWLQSVPSCAFKPEVLKCWEDMVRMWPDSQQFRCWRVTIHFLLMLLASEQHQVRMFCQSRERRRTASSLVGAWSHWKREVWKVCYGGSFWAMTLLKIETNSWSSNLQKWIEHLQSQLHKARVNTSLGWQYWQPYPGAIVRICSETQAITTCTTTQTSTHWRVSRRPPQRWPK